jgi:hypothetical protein
MMFWKNNTENAFGIEFFFDFLKQITTSRTSYIYKHILKPYPFPLAI